MSSNKRYDNNRILVYSCLHFPFHDKRVFDFLNELEREYRFDRVIDLGDTVDQYSFSRYTKSPAALSASEEIKRAKKCIATLGSIFPRVDVMSSNHCFDDKTEILTKNKGFIKFSELSYEDFVGTYNKESKEIEYQKPSYIHNEDYDGDMIHINSFSRDLLITPEHRLFVSKGTTKNYKMVYAKDLISKKSYRVYQKDSGINTNEEYDISDAKLRIIGWYLTDASQSGNQIFFFQRKSKYTDISSILDSLGISYNIYEKDCSRITHICGKKLKKTPENQIVLTCNNFLKDIVPDRYTIPEWMFSLSQRQIDILLDVMVQADGTFLDYRNGEYKVLYGTELFLNQVQILLTFSGYKAAIKSYREKDWKLNIIKRTDSCIDNFYKRFKIEKYSGKIYCATVPNDTLVVRRNGKISITGNCDRLYSKAMINGIPREYIKPYREILEAPQDWKWYKDLSITIDKTRDKVYFCHEKGANALSLAKSISMNVVMGHLHATAGVNYFNNPLKEMFAVQTGCLVSDKGPPFEYNKKHVFRPVKAACIIIDGVPEIRRLK